MELSLCGLIIYEQKDVKSVNEMCGIAGIVSLDKNKTIRAEQAVRMADTLNHRGPDDSGLFFDEQNQIALSFKRLSIIDLQAGNQPITNSEKTVSLVCNGEIYNFQSLRKKLIDEGFAFKTRGDIEPILFLYEKYGIDFIHHLDGFFALAVFDKIKRKLVLAVDRFGKKPLYYAIIDRKFYFASELQAIREIQSSPQLNKNALIDYLRFGYIPAPETIFSNVRKLPPGHLLEIHLDHLKKLSELSPPPPTRYYSLPHNTFEGNYHEAKSELKSLLEEAVNKRLVADVPLGIFLSGGLDSSIVTALASLSSAETIKTFSVGFKNELYNELPLAKLTAEKYKTDHTELMLDFDLNIENLLNRVNQNYDEPFADSSAIPTYLISKEAAHHVKVILTGDGGDEAFFGYDRYRAFEMTYWLTKFGARPFGKAVEVFIPRPGGELRSKKTRFWRLIRALRFSPARQYSMFLRLFFDRQLENILGGELQEAYNKKPDFVAQTLDSLLFSNSPMQKANFTDIMTYLPGDLLTKIDRAAMSVSLEARSPFLDQRIMEFTHSLPLNWLIGLRKGKKILRDTFGHLLPAEILGSPKRGFGLPMGTWLRGPLQNQMKDILNHNCMLVKLGLIDNLYLVRTQAEHIAEMTDHSQRLWALMVLEKFLQKNT